MCLALCLASCAADDSTTEQTATGRPLTVTVSDGGYANAATRTMESSYKTIFTAGDKIGVFAVTGDSVNSLTNNLCLTAATDDNGTLTWKDGNGNALIEIPDATYYAYYPYKEGVAIDVTATTADAAFDALIRDNWGSNMLYDQSSHDDYTSYDLMVASGTVSNGTINFDMSHKMALIVIKLPNDNTSTVTFFSFAPYPLNKDYDYKKFNPYHCDDGTCCEIVHPEEQITFSGTYDDGNNIYYFTKFLKTPEAGSYLMLKIEKGTTENE